MADASLEKFQKLTSQSLSETSKIISDLDQDVEVPANLVARDWVEKNITFETNSAIKKQVSSIDELKRLKANAVKYKINYLKRQATNDEYKDTFNKLVCELADNQKLRLPEAQQVVINTITQNTKDEDVLTFLTQKYIDQKTNNLKASLKKMLNKLAPDIASKLILLLFEIDRVKTDKTWSNRFEDLLVRALSGEKINFISMLCLNNIFEDGRCITVPELDGYLVNPKLEKITLALEEMKQIQRMFEYYGINSSLTIYVANTDYTEIGQYGQVFEDNLKNINAYIQNLKLYAKKLDPNTSVLPISEITDKNLLYATVKKRVLNNLSFTSNEPDFIQRWYGRYEESVEQIIEGQVKKGLVQKGEDISRKGVEITKMLWAVNAAQGAVFSNLGPNTILLSTERRSRDTNYVIDKESTKNFPSVLYILKNG